MALPQRVLEAFLAQPSRVLDFAKYVGVRCNGAHLAQLIDQAKSRHFNLNG